MNLLLIEDEPVVLELLVEYSNLIATNIYTATSLMEARVVLGKHLINGIISDNYLPDGLGIDLVNEINKESEIIPFILITGRVEIELLSRSLNSFVYGFLAKPIHCQEYKDKLKKFKEHAMNTEQIRKLKECYLVSKEAVCCFARKYSLSPREVEIISCNQYGRSNEDISRQLGISKATVKRHWENIFEKTGVHGKRYLMQSLVGRENKR